MKLKLTNGLTFEFDPEKHRMFEYNCPSCKQRNSVITAKIPAYFKCSSCDLMVKMNVDDVRSDLITMTKEMLGEQEFIQGTAVEQEDKPSRFRTDVEF